MDSFGLVRRVLRKLHLWVAMALFVPLVALGLSGSILVYRSEIAALLDPPPKLLLAQGAPHGVAAMLHAAEARLGGGFLPYLYTPPPARGQPALIRLFTPPRAGVRRQIVTVRIDPVSLDLVAWDDAPLPGFLSPVLALHGNLLMGRAGRPYVGWLGVAMLGLGISGLVLWWPRRGRWGAAFTVKRGARGLRLWRDLHGAIGIWTLALFVTVTASGVYFAFPDTVAAGIRALLPSREPAAQPPVPIAAGGRTIDADAAIAAALSATPRARLIALGLPTRPGQPYRVSLAHPGDAQGAPAIVVQVDPGSGAVIARSDPARFAPAQALLAWQRTLHFGVGLGGLWRALVCLTGLLPALFAFTGIAMWLLRRQARRRSDRRRARKESLASDSPSG